jgi:transcriptional regulator with XRE-family HTH domain
MTPLQLRVKELRKLKDWTQEELAERSGVGRVTIARMEAGQTTRVEFDVLEKLAAAFDVAPGYLIVSAELTSRRKK